jgi:hypothetical protein
MGRRRQGNTTHQKTNNLIGNSVENEETEHPGADFSRMMISMSNDSNEVHKEKPKEEL